MNWADSKLPVNSVNPSTQAEGDTEPRQRSMREGVETRHGASIKVCVMCHTQKPLDEFYKKDATGRTDSRCKACRIIDQRFKTLGVTDDQYWSMYHTQAGRCGICTRRLYSKRYKAFCVDHDHTNGRIRGLLCHNCNRALGMFQDDPMTLQRAIEWVKV
jgi:hypothetical protein